MTNRIGILLIALGALHILFGVVSFSEVLGDMIADGLFDTTGDDDERGNAAWFVYAGIGFLALGVAVAQLERHHVAIPGTLAWGLVVWAVIGVVVTPASGYWLLLVVGILAVRASRRAITPGG